MGFLNPLFLLAGVAVLVPIILHLFYRQESKTFSFPAIRYLLRTEKDHARQIRTQQLLLLLLRVAIVLLLVLLGARLHFPGPGGSHEPTALALVLDNSLSTTLIEDGRRRLDTMKAVARRSVEGAGHDDVIWVLRAGTPWEAAVPGGAAQALAAIDQTEPSHGAGDLASAIERARALVGQSNLAAREVHVFTDLQASAFPIPLQGDDTPVVIFAAPAEDRANRSIRSVTIGGGLPPLSGRRTEAAVTVTGGAPGDSVGVRLYIGDQVRAAQTIPVGATVRLPIGPFQEGVVTGYAEIDPDPLTADDRFYFAFPVRDPTPVAVLGAAPFFLTEALAVLEEDDRISLGGVGRAATILSAGGTGLDQRDPSQSAVVFPLSDPAQLPALNRRLADAGIPYRYERLGRGGARIANTGLPLDLGDVGISQFFRITPLDPDFDEDGAIVTLSTGDPWLLAGTTPLGPYVLLASPLDDRATTLPVSAAMIPLLEWAIDRWSVGGGEPVSVTAGSSFRPPPVTTVVRDPDGVEHRVDGDQPFLNTSKVGFYTSFAADSLLTTTPVNTPAAEMDLTPASATEVRRNVPGISSLVGDATSWNGSIFRAGRGPEPWRMLGVVLLALLIAETIVAASSRLRASPGGDRPLRPTGA